MQKDMKNILQEYGLKLQEIEILNEGEQESREEKVYRILDSDRMIFFIELEHIKNKDFEYYVDRLMDWTHLNLLEGETLAEQYGEVSMKMILWDMYAIFGSCISEENREVQEEEIYRIQRNRHFMKRYVVQESSKEKIAEKVSFLVQPEKRIDDFVNELEYDSDEAEYCRNMSDVQSDSENSKSVVSFRGETYQEILTLLKKINDIDFGENIDEDTGN